MALLIAINLRSLIAASEGALTQRTLSNKNQPRAVHADLRSYLY